MSHTLEHLQQKAAKINEKKEEQETPPETTREEFLQAQRDYLQTLIEDDS